MKFVQQWGGDMTSSIPKDRCEWLFNVLSYKVPSKHWRSAINEDNIIGSVHVYEDKGKFQKKHILSTAFGVIAEEEEETTEIVPQTSMYILI